MTYFELKTWFLEHMHELPSTLGCKYVFFNDLKKKINDDIKFIDENIEKFGLQKVRIMAGPRGARNRLLTAYKLLQDKSNWNIKKPPHNPFNNRNFDKVETKKTIILSKSEQQSLERIKSAGLFVDVENKNIAIPYGFQSNEVIRKSLETLEKCGFLTTRATFEL